MSVIRQFILFKVVFEMHASDVMWGYIIMR